MRKGQRAVGYQMRASGWLRGNLDTSNPASSRAGALSPHPALRALRVDDIGPHARWRGKALVELGWCLEVLPCNNLAGQKPAGLRGAAPGMTKLLLALTMLSATISQPAYADGTVIANVQGWQIIRYDDYCLMAMEYEGEGNSSLFYTLFDNDWSMIAAVNDNWTTEDDKDYPDMAFHLGENIFDGGTTKGFSSDGKHGFWMNMDTREFMPVLRGSGFLHIYNKDVVVDRLSLKGSSAALDSIIRCVDGLKAKKAAAARKAAPFKDIPLNPFAKP